MNSSKDAVEDTDALIIATEWAEFRSFDLNRFKNMMHQPIVFDGRNLYNIKKAQNAGITYVSVGRKNLKMKAVQHEAA